MSVINLPDNKRSGQCDTPRTARKAYVFRVLLGVFFAGIIYLVYYVYEASKTSLFHVRLDHGDVWVVQNPEIPLLLYKAIIVWKKKDRFVAYYLKHDIPRLRNLGIKEDADDILVTINSKIVGRINTKSGLFLNTLENSKEDYVTPLAIYKGDDPTKRESPAYPGFSPWEKEFSRLFDGVVRNPVEQESRDVPRFPAGPNSPPENGGEKREGTDLPQLRVITSNAYWRNWRRHRSRAISRLKYGSRTTPWR